MITGLVFSLALYFMLASYGIYQARKKQSLYWQDIASPFITVAGWTILTALGYGHQSLSHFIEVPLSLLGLLVIFYLKIWGLTKLFTDKPWLLPLTGLFIAVLLRTFMPYLPE